MRLNVQAERHHGHEDRQRDEEQAGAADRLGRTRRVVTDHEVAGLTMITASGLSIASAASVSLLSSRNSTG